MSRIPINRQGHTFDNLFLKDTGRPKFRNSGETIRFKKNQVYQHVNNPFSLSAFGEKKLQVSWQAKFDGSKELRDSLHRGFGSDIASAVFRKANIKDGTFLTGSSLRKLNNALIDLREELTEDNAHGAFDFIRGFNKCAHDFEHLLESEQEDALREQIRTLVEHHVLAASNDPNGSFIGRDVRKAIRQEWSTIQPNFEHMNLSELKAFRDQHLLKVAQAANSKIETKVYNFGRPIGHHVEKVWKPTPEHFLKLKSMISRYNDLQKALPDNTGIDERLRVRDEREELISSLVQFDLKLKGNMHMQKTVEIYLPPWLNKNQTPEDYFNKVQEDHGITNDDIAQASEKLSRKNRPAAPALNPLTVNNTADNDIAPDIDATNEEEENAYNPWNLSIEVYDGELTDDDDFDMRTGDTLMDSTLGNSLDMSIGDEPEVANVSNEPPSDQNRLDVIDETSQDEETEERDR